MQKHAVHVQHASLPSENAVPAPGPALRPTTSTSSWLSRSSSPSRPVTNRPTVVGATSVWAATAARRSATEPSLGTFNANDRPSMYLMHTGISSSDSQNNDTNSRKAISCMLFGLFLAALWGT